jgi:UDP-N-acetylglucosamine 2-epimerase (non-hydrolysing)
MRILNVAGARPNFVKIAPLVREMRRHPTIVPLLVHTGQHYDEVMSGQLFRDLEIPAPDFNLEVGSASHAVQTAEVMRRLEPVLLSTRPDLVLVVGDVNSTLAAALTAVKLGIPVAHVEAGLRSFDRTMPEEINRILTDAIADLLFVTEESGREHLLREGIAADRIHFVGNVMIDALMTFRPHWQHSSVFDRLALHENQPYTVLTLHRPSNVDDPTNLTKLLDALQDVARHIPIVFPVHPRVRARLAVQEDARVPARDAEALSAGKGIAYLDPLGYLDFIALMSRARLVLTDSGGIQEETTILGVPCLTLRDNTERPATVTWGTNRVIGTDPRRIVEEALRALNHPPRPNGPPPLWDGRAASRIVEALLQYDSRRLRERDEPPGGSFTMGTHSRQ